MGATVSRYAIIKHRLCKCSFNSGKTLLKAAMNGELILVIDDSREIVKHLTEYLLPTLGHKAIAAYDGRQGLELIRQEKPDLVMLDLNLPEMTGLDVLQALTQDSIETPVILMTGYGSEKSAIEAFRLGIKDYLVKPFTIDEVSDTIERALLETRLRHDKQQLLEKLGRAEGEMRRQIREMRSLFALGKSLTSLLSIEKVLDHALQGAMDLTGAERSTIWVPDGGERILQAYSKSAWEEDDGVSEVLIGESRVGDVYRTGQIVRRADFSGGGIEIQADRPARAILYVPLTVRGKVMGVFGVSNHDAPRAFGERDELLLSALSDYVAIAIDNARTYQATDQALAARMEEVKTLLGITRTITSSLDLDEVARLTIKEVHASWNIEASSIWLVDDDRKLLRLLVNVGTDPDILSRFRLELGQGIVGRVVETGRPLYSNDVPNNPYHYREIDEQTGFKTRSILCVPLIFREEVIGALQLLNKRNGFFDAEDVERASSIATAVAIAVTNAQLFEEAASRQQLLAATLEYNGNPVVITDNDGRLLLLNQRAREELSLTGEAVGRSAGEVLEGSPLMGMLKHPPREGKGLQRREVELHDGQFWLATIAPIPDYGHILVLQDITYLKELDTAKSNFVATVSHDLRAPLNSIIGFASALEQMGPLTDKQTEFVNRITDSAQRMTNLVTALLDLARVDSRLEQVREECNLADIARSVLTDLQGQALTKDVALNLVVEETPRPVLGDPTQLRQAVSNLVDNAIKYSAAGQEVEVDVTMQDDNVLVRVCDDGKGIPAQDIPHIFEKFYRGKDKASKGGTGLGLTLVRSIAEAHGGWVWVESDQNMGSTFTLQLPAGGHGALEVEGADGSTA